MPENATERGRREQQAGDWMRDNPTNVSGSLPDVYAFLKMAESSCMDAFIAMPQGDETSVDRAMRHFRTLITVSYGLAQNMQAVLDLSNEARDLLIQVQKDLKEAEAKKAGPVVKTRPRSRPLHAPDIDVTTVEGLDILPDNSLVLLDHLKGPGYYEVAEKIGTHSGFKSQWSISGDIFESKHLSSHLPAKILHVPNHEGI